MKLIFICYKMGRNGWIRMKKRLIIIVLALLLVGGISLAYFSGSIFSGGTSSTGEGTLVNINNSTFIVEGTLEFNDTDIYPGHTNVARVRVTATGDNELIPYNLIWEGTNTLNTPLNYTVYKTSTNIDVEATCEKTRETVNGAIRYLENCSISNIDSLGTSVANGTINTGDTNITLVKDEFITALSSGETVYYYVVLEYPNLDQNQNSDIGGTFTGEVTVEMSNASPDIQIIAAYIEQEDGSYLESEDIPQSGYALNSEKSVCSNGSIPSWDVINARLNIDDLTKSGTSCYLYFDEAVAADYILANKTIQERTSFSSVLTSNTNGTIYQAPDGEGTSYYFAGNTTENWLSFAGFYWRIIRINGDGTVRIIYNGTGTSTTGTSTQLSSTSTFNSSSNNNMYVGYMYTSGQVHGLETSSTIKGTVDTWYQNNIANNSEYTSKISTTTGFCGDRTSTTTYNGAPNDTGGTGTTITYYGARYRLYTNKTPTYDCPDPDNDLYTVDGAGIGNEALTYPVGLITADEVAYAGGVYQTNNDSYYLYTNSAYWALSPSYFNGSDAYGFHVYSNGGLRDSYVTPTYGVRPVLNLRADVQLTGSGTADDPFVVN